MYEGDDLVVTDTRPNRLKVKLIFPVPYEIHTNTFHRHSLTLTIDVKKTLRLK